ncbi:MAG TPA: hypothetical protein VFI11_11930, partial [Anaerolineales bacterium]|nr:hypothetical protein [Anaerolineales bacterium]
LATTGYIESDERVSLVRRWFGLADEAARLEGQVAASLAGPGGAGQEAQALSEELGRVRRELSRLQPAAEAVLAEQAELVIEAEGLAGLGEVFPPVSFRLSKLPVALIVSPRTVIRQDASIQLEPQLPLLDQVALETRVEQTQDVSALVVPVGGIGTYPTMIQETGALGWVAEVVLHEWTHNYLTLRPLGWNYETNAELRTMNETAAQLMGQALGRRLLEAYYPDLLPPEVVEAPAPGTQASAPSFNFQAEMHTTRLRVDELLSRGQVEVAEAYMEAQRQVFVAHGYAIRRLNQAYFAFYGAYADTPQGPAGEDPVGAAVRELWARVKSPAEFLRLMASMDEVADLERALGRPVTNP